MSKYEVRFWADTNTYLVLELVMDCGDGNRHWEIVDECDTEAEAHSVRSMLLRAEEQEIYAEFG
jgi:hypothetical protein